MGDNVIVVTVTAEDAATTLTYTITVTRAAVTAPVVTISADKTSAVFEGGRHHLHADAHRLDDRRPARHGRADADRGFPGGGGPREDGDD